MLIKGVLGTTALAVAGPAPLFSTAARAQAQRPAPPTDITTRVIPRTNEAIPALGLGTFLTFDTIPGHKRDHLLEVVRRYWEGGVRVIDTSPLYGTAETTVGDFATSIGINDQIFVANKLWVTGDYLMDESHALKSLALSESRLWRERIDLMQCHSLVNVDVVVPYMRAWKKEGRIRFAGVTHFQNEYLEPLALWVERGDLDFVQVNYSIFNRAAEERVLRAAAARGTAVLTNMPFEKARLFKVTEGRQVPDFARDFSNSWAEFFLKWVISNPVVTCALAATANPDHAAENVRALKGPLPDPEMRQRMVLYMESLPGFSRIAEMPWYPDRRYPGIIGRSQQELRTRT